jgi:Protein of unknown function (DUF3631)/Toprim-like
MLNGNSLLSTQEAARLLGGEVAGPDQVLCPGPGHSPKDRSLSVRFCQDAPGGFVIHSFAEERTPASVGRARDYVREKLGLPAWQPRSDNGKTKRTKRSIAAVHPYVDEEGKLLFEVVRYVPKKFSQRRPDGSGDVIWNLMGVRIVPYRLPELLEAIANERAVFVVEGEKDVESLAKLDIIATCNAGGAGNWKEEHAKYLKGADVIIIPDNDDQGRKHVESVAVSLSAFAARVRTLTLPDLPPKGDVSNWIENGGTAEQLWALVEQAPDWRPARADEARQGKEKIRRAHWSVEPWPESVTGTQLLDELASTLKRYIVLPDHAEEAMALHIMHAWTIDAVDISPYLVIVSPTKQCGKTTLLILIYWLTPRSVLASNISGPAAYRFIEKELPTLIVDEADSFVKEDENMRGILNSGHTKPAAFVIRCEGEGSKQEPREFSTWCPKVIASIGPLADTLMDRSVRIMMRRKTKGEKVARRPLRDTPELTNLRRRCLRWATDNMQALATAEPVMPDALFNRLGDNWEPLLAIADLVGGEWPERARTAALALSGVSDDQDRGIELLGDIRRVFHKTKLDWLGAKALVGHLIDLEDAPWAEWHNGKPISTRRVYLMLKDYHIKSRHEREANRYHKKDFEEAWESYLPPLGGIQAPQPPLVCDLNALVGFQSSTLPPSCGALKPA